jgi:hypothetical protein
MTMAVHWGNTDGIARSGMSRATSEATGCRHWATTCSILPQGAPGQQANKQQSTNTPTLLAVSMAMGMGRYVTACIAQWRRSRALLEATGCRHWASIMSDNIKGTWLCHFFMSFIVKTVEKSHGSKLRPLFSIGVSHIKQNATVADHPANQCTSNVLSCIRLALVATGQAQDSNQRPKYLCYNCRPLSQSVHVY